MLQPFVESRASFFMDNLRKLKRVVIKEEIVAITGDTTLAIVLGQLMYWQERVKDYDQYIAEEERRCIENGIEREFYRTYGWIYKKASDLIDECMLNVSDKSMRIYLKKLEDMKFISSRENPQYKWDKTKQYSVNTMNILKAVKEHGYTGIDGFIEIQRVTEAGDDDLLFPEEEKDLTSGKNFRSRGENFRSRGENFGAISEITYRDYMTEEEKEKNACAREISVAAKNGSISYTRKRGNANDSKNNNTPPGQQEPRVPDYLREQWQRWYSHVQTTKRPFTSTESMQLCIDDIDKHCCGDTSIADRVITNAIKHRYDYLVFDNKGENNQEPANVEQRNAKELIIDGIVYR